MPPVAVVAAFVVVCGYWLPKPNIMLVELGPPAVPNWLTEPILGTKLGYIGNLPLISWWLSPAAADEDVLPFYC